MTESICTRKSEFLAGERLAERIREVASAPNASCAVAFWSEDGIDRVFDGPAAAKRAQLLCDISMGATSPDALEKLGAPQRKTLRHLPGLHAKIYLSDLGLVTASANASVGALGTSTGAARLIETGTYHPPRTAEWNEASAWFGKVFKGAAKVDSAALDWARQVYRPSRPFSKAAPQKNSLLDAVRVNPERFAGIGFVFTKQASDEDEIDKAKAAAKRKNTRFSDAAIDAWSDGGFFTGWSKDEAACWPSIFFEFWQPRQRLSVFAKSVSIHDPDNGSVMARRDWALMRRRLGRDLPSSGAIEAADASTAALVLGDKPGRLFVDARALADRLNKLLRTQTS